MNWMVLGFGEEGMCGKEKGCGQTHWPTWVIIEQIFS
jgi:hypothetical protein